MKQLYLFITVILFLVQKGYTQNIFKISDGNVVVWDNVNLVIKDSEWINNGSFDAYAGTVIISGEASSEESVIGGTNYTSFNNLTINKAVNNVNMEQWVSVNNQLTLQSGCMDIMDNDFVIFSGLPIIGGSETSYIKTSGFGDFYQVIGADPVFFPVGNSSYNPITISNTGTESEFAVAVTDEVLSEGYDGIPLTENIVNRTWHVFESFGEAINLDMEVQWNQSDELPEFDRNNCYLSHYTGGEWDIDTPQSADGNSPYTLSRSGITSLSPFSVNSSLALPIELLNFTAFQKEEGVELGWTTNSEINSDLFVIEHATDGISFKEIGRKSAAGYSSTRLEYDFLHQTPNDGLNYYRLKMVDSDNSFNYSEIRSVNFHSSKNSSNQVMIYPNPVSDFLNVQIQEGAKEVRIELYNELGQQVLKQNIQNGSKKLWIGNLAAGTYYLNMVIDGEVFEKKVFISR